MNKSAAAVHSSHHLTSSFQSRARSLLIACTLIILLTGCSWLSPRRLQLPPDFAARPIAPRLLDPQARAAAYRDLFPALPNLHLGGRLDVRGKWWQGSGHTAVALIAITPPDARPASQALRLRASLVGLGTTLFDVMVAHGDMTAIVNAQGLNAYFEGPIPDEGSPFRQHYGVEPWDLIPIFTLGTRLGDTATLIPNPSDPWQYIPAPQSSASPSDGLVSISLEPQSGLPRQATWQRAGHEWTVEYFGWKDFTDDPTADRSGPRDAITRLMPSKVEVVRSDPYTRLTLTLDTYQFGGYVPPGFLQMQVPRGFQRVPLERLGEVLP